jgi:hypothetical protein
MRAIQAAERFVKRMDAAPATAARLAQAGELLKALNAVRWEDATPEDREAGWSLTLRLTLLKQDPGRRKPTRRA